MTIRRRLTPDETAILLLLLRRRREEETGKALSRFRISRSTMRRVSGRHNLRDSFVHEVDLALRERGWALLPVSDNYGLVRLDVVGGWVRVSAKRIANDIEQAHNPKAEFDFDAVDEVAEQAEAEEE